MTQKPHGWEIMEPLCIRVHNGESRTAIEVETGISVTTIIKYYRKWCIKNGHKEVRLHPTQRPLVGRALEAPIPIVKYIPPINATVLAIPDTHHPFVHPDALSFLKEVRSTKKTNLSLCLGDEIDAHAFSRYPMDPDGLTAGQELKAAIESITPLYREFPEMLVCESNHTVRPWKRAYEAGLPAAFLPTYSKLLNAPEGWRWATQWWVNDVLYIHGDNGKSGQYAHVNYMKSSKHSVVIGHMHSYAGVNYEANHFAVNSGCLIDESAYCFKYARNMIVKVNLGCSVIYEGKYAEFIPMRLDNNQRWIGRL